jgi:hypothetical protein
MLRNKPKVQYCGLTVIMSNPSRFDKVSLLTSGGGDLFNNYCLRPDYNQMQCDIRLTDDKSPFLEGTKAVLVLGERAMHEWLPMTRNNTLNELRGGLYHIGNIPVICSFLPQDATDAMNWESRFNSLAGDYSGDEDEGGSEEDKDEGDVKSAGKTSRKNYAFWIHMDTKKVKKLLKGFVPVKKQPNIIIQPSSKDVIDALQLHKDKPFFFDIETNYERQDMLCFAFSWDANTVWSVPTIDYNYQWAYPDLPNIIRHLALCISRNIVVAHNGSNFDGLVMGLKYRIPIVRMYDTMLALHRCYPSVEKSLMHGISLMTWENFHKDMDSHCYRTSKNMYDKLHYCGRDVYGMVLLYNAIQEFAAKIPGLADSIASVQRAIRPYLTTTMQGIRYDETKAAAIRKENDKLMMQYNRMINLLIGEQGMTMVRSAVKGKAKLMPGSNTQCSNYFHELLGYPVIARSPDTQKPMLGKKTLYRLQLKHPNPVIKFINMYRQTQKETSAIAFRPFRDDANNILPRTGEEPTV